MKEIQITRKKFLRGARRRKLRYKRLLLRFKAPVSNKYSAEPLLQQIGGEVKDLKGRRHKKKRKKRKWKPREFIDNFGRQIYVPVKYRKLKINHASAKWLEIQQRKRLAYARLDIRFSGRRRRFRYDPNFKPKHRYFHKKKPEKRLKLISKKKFAAKEREETYETYIKKFRDQRLRLRNRKKERVFKKLRRESRMLKIFVGALIRKGKKSTAIKILRSLIRLISVSKFYKRRKYKNPLRPIFRAVLLASPRIMLKSKRVGGIIYRLPIFIEGSRRTRSLGMRWIIASAQRRPEKLMAERLANEIIDIHRKKGLTIKRKAEVYSVGVGNKAFVHYMWRKKKRRKKALKKINRR
jgi:small subunit ribosomal protein S7